MAWITITDRDAATCFLEWEWQALAESARNAGAGDVVQESINRTVARVRGYVRSCERNQLGASGTVPEELRSATLALLMEDLATNLPASGVVLDEGRGQRITRAHRELELVAQCKFLVGEPATPATDSPAVDEGGYGGDDYDSDFDTIR